MRAPAKRGKVRRVLSSSPAPQSTPLSGEDLVTTPAHTEQPIEIRESPEASTLGALVHYDGGDSPLFVPQDSPVVPSQDLAFIEPSAPPSSYQEYDTGGSTQVGKLIGLFESSQPLPESQQTTAGAAVKSTTQALAVLATSPNVSSEAPTPAHQSTGRVVPDSQSLLTSTNHVSQPQVEAQSNNADKAGSQLIGDLEAAAQPPVAESQEPSSINSNQAPLNRTAEKQRERQPVFVAEHSSYRQQSLSSRPVSPEQSFLTQQPAQRQEKPTPSPPVSVAGSHLHASANSVASSPVEYRESIEVHTAQAVVPVADHCADSQTFESLQTNTSFPFQTQVPPAQTQAVAQISTQPLLPSHSQPTTYHGHLAKLLESVPRSNSLPVLDSSLSSPLPSIPTHSLPAIGESAPPLPLIPSTPAHSPAATPNKDRLRMERRTPTSEPKMGSMAARIKAMKAEQAAKRGLTPSASPNLVTPPKPSAVPPRLNAELAADTPSHAGSPEPSRNGGRSPSAVPAALPVKTVTQDEMNTSGRYPTLVPQEKENPFLRRQSTITGTASKENLKGGNYVHSVPIALLGHQRDSYPLMIQQHKDIIERFLDTTHPDQELTVEIETLLERLRRIVVHPDLDNVETYTQYDVPPAAHAKWATDCSAKFYFLKHLIDELRTKRVDIAVICQSGQLLQILENFSLGLKVSCYRADTGQTTEQDGCELMFKIMSTQEDASYESLSADAVICMDNSAEAGGSTLKLFQERPGSDLVMMALAAPGTIEHVERCLSPQLTYQQKLRALVHGIFDLRHISGKLEHGQLPSVETAKVIADFITSKTEDREWSVAALSMLENLDSQTESDIDPPQGDEAAHLGEKRPLHASEMLIESPDTSKRRRLESNGVHSQDQPITINPLELDLSHISDSVPVPSNPPIDNSSLVDPSDLNETVKRLQSLLLTAQTSLADHKHDLSELQYRHEDQRNEFVELSRKKDEAIDMAQKAVTRMTEGAATTSALRTENRSLKDQIAAMQQTLANHSVPERAEFEKQRIAFEQVQKDNQILEKRLKVQQKDLDYAQEMYQNSSSAAQRLGTTNRELENTLAHVQNRASGEQARAKQMTLDARSANLIRENKLLKAKIREQAETLARKDKELSLMKEASRGRMGTRGTSVPRSPRMASPLKHGGSRQSSPAAGELRGRTHPLRQG